MFSIICGTCALSATYKTVDIFLKPIAVNGDIIVRTGCKLISLYAGISMANKITGTIEYIKDSMAKESEEK